MKALLTCITLFCAQLIWGQSTESLTVYFDFNKDELNTAALSRLDSLTRTGLPRPLGITLAGYCDSTGSDQYNNRLSYRRALTVRNYLVASGIAPDSIINATGYGERDPLNGNGSEEERGLNRRVEISITSKERDTVEEKLQYNQPGLQQQLTDPAITSGSNIVLKNISFYGGNHNFLQSSYPALKELLETMKNHPSLEIEVQGHVCCLPGDADGYDEATGGHTLSEMRAKAVRDFLVKNGIEPARVSYKGFGHSHPIYPYPEQTDEERIANRRVEIRIIKK